MNSGSQIDVGNNIEINILNCGHIVTCLDCELRTITCPYCGAHIVTGTKIKFTDYNASRTNNQSRIIP